MVSGTRRRVAGLAAVSGALAAVLAGCDNPPAGPACMAAVIDTASVSGDTITTSLGLRFVDVTVGSGVRLTWCTAVSVHYTGYLLDGTQFDSSRDIDRPLRFAPGVGSLIDGFEQGVIGMRTGGTRRLIIPPTLAYGADPVLDNSGAVLIPANSTIVFDVEVLVIGP